MKKLFFITCFNILFVIRIFGQAAVDIPLSATDGTYTIPFSVGLDLTATNCIDTLLGECGGEPPPFPPPGVYDFRIDLAPYGCGIVFACRDYRPPGNPPAFPFTGSIEHTLWFQVSSPGFPLNINYNLPEAVQMAITDQLGGTFLNIGPLTGQGIATIPGSYTMIFSRFLLIMNYDNIVPVTLTSLTASTLQNENAVQLNWTTATETNNSGFEIQRLKDSKIEGLNDWEVIRFVPGFGTTTEPKSYSFVDENITTGTYKYRLKQIDFDGTFTYSNEIEVEVDFTPKEFVLYQNYPNPFNPSTKISWQSPVGSWQTLKIYDILGNEVITLVDEYRAAGKYEIDFNLASGIRNPASGVYFYKLIAGEFTQTRKMIVLR